MVKLKADLPKEFFEEDMVGVNAVFGNKTEEEE